VQEEGLLFSSSQHHCFGGFLDFLNSVPHMSRIINFRCVNFQCDV